MLVLAFVDGVEKGLGVAEESGLFVVVDGAASCVAGLVGVWFPKVKPPVLGAGAPLAGLPKVKPPVLGEAVAAPSDPNLKPVPCPPDDVDPKLKLDFGGDSLGRSSFLTPGLRVLQAGHFKTSPLFLT